MEKEEEDDNDGDGGVGVNGEDSVNGQLRRFSRSGERVGEGICRTRRGSGISRLVRGLGRKG